MELLGYISAGCFSVCYIPQLLKTWKAKSTEGVSPWMWSIMGVAHLTGMIYAASLGSTALVLNFSLGLMYTYIWIVMWWCFRDPKRDYVKKLIKEVIRDAKKGID